MFLMGHLSYFYIKALKKVRKKTPRSEKMCSVWFSKTGGGWNWSIVPSNMQIIESQITKLAV